MWGGGISKRMLPREHLASHDLERINLLALLLCILFLDAACISDVHFLAIIWEQDVLPCLVGGSGACGLCETALTD